MVRLPTRGARRAECRRRHAPQRRSGSRTPAGSRRALPLRPERPGCGAVGAARHPDGPPRSQPARGLGACGPAPRRAYGPSPRRRFPGARDGQCGVPAPSPEHSVPGVHRLGQSPDRHRRGELPGPPRHAGGSTQRLPRHQLALGAGLNRDDRRARSGVRRRPVGQHRGTALCGPSGVASGARGTAETLPVASGPAVRTSRAARRAGRARAAATPRHRAVKYVLLAVAALVTLAAAVLLGPADVPLGDIVTSPIVWQLRLPRAVLAFLVGGALGVSGVGLQALVRNPLADPFLLGLSGGAGLDPRVLLLGGVAVGAFAAAITTAIVSLAQATELRNAFLWLWGGF